MVIQRDKRGCFIKGKNIGVNSFNYNPDYHIFIEDKCRCGCGSCIIYRKSQPKYFIHSHNLRVLSEESRKRVYVKGAITRRNNGIPRLTPLYKLIKGNQKYQDWRKAVYFRDNFTCQECGYKGRNLQAHHKKPFAFLYKEAIEVIGEKEIYQKILQYEPLFELSNGITLCEPCHRKIIHPNYKIKKDVFV